MNWPGEPDAPLEWCASLKALEQRCQGVASRAEWRALKSAGAPCFHSSGRVEWRWALLCLVAHYNAPDVALDEAGAGDGVDANRINPRAADWLQERARINAFRDDIKLAHERGEILRRSEVRETTVAAWSALVSGVRRMIREIVSDLVGRSEAEIDRRLLAEFQSLLESMRSKWLAESGDVSEDTGHLREEGDVAFADKQVVSRE